jgi:hypothetical protein
VDYELTARSKELLPVLGALARWGYDWAWTAPRESEAIDIGAILRIAPGLVQPPESTSGVAAFVVRVDDATTKHYTLTVHRGAVTIAEREDEAADVRITGSQDDWIDALGPDGDSSGLNVQGDRRLASLLLSGIGAVAERDVRVA